MEYTCKRWNRRYSNISPEINLPRYYKTMFYCLKGLRYCETMFYCLKGLRYYETMFYYLKGLRYFETMFYCLKGALLFVCNTGHITLTIHTITWLAMHWQCCQKEHWKWEILISVVQQQRGLLWQRGILLSLHGAIDAAAMQSVYISCVLDFCHHCCTTTTLLPLLPHRQ